LDDAPMKKQVTQFRHTYGSYERSPEIDAYMEYSKEVLKKGKLDPNVESVIDKYKSRANVGFEKYGTDTTRTDIDLLGWLTHLQEELMDATIYVERIKNELKG